MPEKRKVLMDWLTDLAPSAQVAAITVLGVIGTAIFTFFGVFLNLLSRWRDRAHEQKLKKVERQTKQYEWLIDQRTKDAEALVKRVNHFHKLAVNHLDTLTKIHSQVSDSLSGSMPTRATRISRNSRIVIRARVEPDQRAQPDWFFASTQELNQLVTKVIQDKQLTASWFRSEAALYWTWFPNRKRVSTNLSELDAWFEQFYSGVHTLLEHVKDTPIRKRHRQSLSNSEELSWKASRVM